MEDKEFLNKKAQADEKRDSAQEENAAKASEHPQLDIAQDIRQNSGNNDSTNAMIIPEKNSNR